MNTHVEVYIKVLNFGAMCYLDFKASYCIVIELTSMNVVKLEVAKTISGRLAANFSPAIIKTFRNTKYTVLEVCTSLLSLHICVFSHTYSLLVTSYCESV